MDKTSIVFTGQGSQIIGMGKDFFEKYPCATAIFNKFDDVLNKKISEICFNGTEDDLKQTINSQPCILAVELAILETLKQETNLKIDYVAGHSLGEYGALYCANVINLENAIKLIQARANAMNKVNTGSMSAIIGLDEQTLLEIKKETSSVGYVDIANYNTPEQTVITGENIAVEKFNEIALKKGAKRAITLAVSGAFHSQMMKKASEEFAITVNEIELHDAKIPVITNVDAKPTTNAEYFREKMISQIYSSVQWVKTLNYLKEQGVTNFIEIGPSKILAGMVRKTLKDINVTSICNINDLEKVINEIKIGV